MQTVTRSAKGFHRTLTRAAWPVLVVLAAGSTDGTTGPRPAAFWQRGDLEPLLKEPPNDVTVFGKPMLRAHPSGDVLLQPYDNPIVTGFSCKPECDTHSARSRDMPH